MNRASWWGSGLEPVFDHWRKRLASFVCSVMEDSVGYFIQLSLLLLLFARKLFLFIVFVPSVSLRIGETDWSSCYCPIKRLFAYSFIIFFSFCRWWRCCFRRPRGSVVLFGGRRIAGPTVMPGSASMAYKMSSRPMGPIGGVGERRAMGDSSHYEEIALIGNGKSNTLFIFYYYLLDRAEFIRWYLCVDRSIITHGFEYLLRFHNFCVEKCWKNQIEANR